VSNDGSAPGSERQALELGSFARRLRARDKAFESPTSHRRAPDD
jgi:hypothetical protein